jgi:hypothetical protein
LGKGETASAGGPQKAVLGYKGAAARTKEVSVFVADFRKLFTCRHFLVFVIRDLGGFTGVQHTEELRLVSVLLVHRLWVKEHVSLHSADQIKLAAALACGGFKDADSLPIRCRSSLATVQ